MKSLFFCASFMLASSATLAATGDLECVSAYQSLHITASSARAATGSYDSVNGQFPLRCVRGKKQTGSLKTLWKCVESRSGEGRFVLEVVSGGITGGMSVLVSQEQIFPFPPQALEAFDCI